MCSSVSVVSIQLLPHPQGFNSVALLWMKNDSLTILASKLLAQLFMKMPTHFPGLNPSPITITKDYCNYKFLQFSALKWVNTCTSGCSGNNLKGG